jgi:hypothetical protein
VPFALLALAAFLVSRWLGVGLHEVLGHGLFASLTGGSFYGVYISPASGFALVHLPRVTPDALRVLVVLAGILVEILVGVLLFRGYPRARTFVGRLFVLALLEILLVYSFAYLGLGVFGATGGDPAEVVRIIGAPHLGFALLAVGVLWAVAVGYAISVEVLRLVAPALSLRRQLAYVMLFWTVPLPVAAIPNALSAVLAPVSLITYVLLLVMIGSALFFGGFRLSKDAQELPPLERPSGRWTPLAIAAVLVLPAWFAFGITSESAEHLLIGEPPLGAEREFANLQAVNVRVVLTATQDVELEFRMKGVPDLRSPLERRAFATFEDRADFTFWSPEAGLLARTMMNATLWNVSGERIDSSGTVWFDGGERPNPRLVTLQLARPEDEDDFLNVTQVGNRTFLTLTVRDPFRNLPLGCPGCFLDEFNITWPAAGPGGSYVLVGVTAQGGNSEELVDPGLRFARYRARAYEESPGLWQLVLEVT